MASEWNWRSDLRAWLIGLVVGLALDGINHLIHPGREGQLFLILLVAIAPVEIFAIGLMLFRRPFGVKRTLLASSVALATALAHLGLAYLLAGDAWLEGPGMLVLRGMGLLGAPVALLLAALIRRAQDADRTQPR